MFLCSPLWFLCGIADPLWSCVMLLCGPLWVLLQSFAVFSDTATFSEGSYSGSMLLALLYVSLDNLLGISISVTSLTALVKHTTVPPTCSTL